jgi:hypothetical protein
MSRNQTFFLVAASALLWPAIHIVVFTMRFPQNPVDYVGALVFAPMGFIAGLFASNLLVRSVSARQKLLVVLGYLAFTPLAFWGSLGGGLLFHPVIGSTIIGPIPLILGCWIGFVIGRWITPKEKKIK